MVVVVVMVVVGYRESFFFVIFFSFSICLPISSFRLFCLPYIFALRSLRIG